MGDVAWHELYDMVVLGEYGYTAVPYNCDVVSYEGNALVPLSGRVP